MTQNIKILKAVNILKLVSVQVFFFIYGSHSRHHSSHWHSTVNPNGIGDRIGLGSHNGE